jgi:hypothetical protein
VQTKGSLENRQVLVPAWGVLNIRAADAKEVGVGNPAEETCCHPNELILRFCNTLSIKFRKSYWPPRPRGFAHSKSPRFITSKRHLHGVIKALASKTANPMQGTLRKGSRGNSTDIQILGRVHEDAFWKRETTARFLPRTAAD